MVNGASRRSHDSKDELRGKPTSVGANAGERLSLTGLGKALQGKPRSKPESGNPTFRDCRGARGNVTWSYDRVRAPRLYPDPGSWFVPPGNNRSSGGGNEAAEAFGAEGRDGDLVSMQAVTRVNAEQASKRVVQEPTRLSLGEGRCRWDGTSGQVSSVLPG